MQITSKEKNLLFFLALLVLVMINLKFVITPGITKKQQLQEQLLALEDKKFQTDQLLAKANTIDEQIEEVLGQIKDVTPPFFDRVDKEYIHVWIEGLVHKNQVTLEQLTLNEPQITTVTPYIKDKSNLSYPIKESFNILQKFYQTEAVEQETSTSDGEISNLGEGVDQVVQVDLILNIKGTKASIMNLVSELSHLGKHAIVNNVDFAAFNTEEEKTTTITLSLYSIDKETDGTFNYSFN